jgi:gag-polypeptide of LTR copia-type
MAPQPKISIKLTNVTLSDLNYQSWVRAVKISLEGRGKLGYVIGTVKKPALSIVLTEAELTALEEWEIQDQEVVSWLVASMEPHIAEICTY